MAAIKGRWPLLKIISDHLPLILVCGRRRSLRSAHHGLGGDAVVLLGPVTSPLGPTSHTQWSLHRAGLV
jgi:hypothetical protein